MIMPKINAKKAPATPAKGKVGGQTGPGAGPAGTPAHGKKAPNTPDDVKRLLIALARTGEPDWPTVGIPPNPGSMMLCLNWPAADAERLGLQAGRMGSQLPQQVLTPAEAQARAKEPLPAQSAWLRDAAVGAGKYDGVVPDGKTREQQLGEYIDKDSLVRSLEVQTGRAKDRGMNVRAVLGSFQWFTINQVLTELRRRVQAEPDPKKYEPLISKFAPMLIIVEQIGQQLDARRGKVMGKRVALQEEVSQAKVDEKMSSTMHAYHSGQEVSRADLVDLARHLEQKADPASAEPAKAAGVSGAGKVARAGKATRAGKIARAGQRGSSLSRSRRTLH